MSGVRYCRQAASPYRARWNTGVDPNAHLDRNRIVLPRRGTRRDRYVFCSTRLPAIISTEKEATAAVVLAPLSDWEYEKALNNYLIYLEVCHNAGAQVTSE